jgi:hypothetical protein
LLLSILDFLSSTFKNEAKNKTDAVTLSLENGNYNIIFQNKEKKASLIKVKVN